MALWRIQTQYAFLVLLKSQSAVLFGFLLSYLIFPQQESLDSVHLSFSPPYWY